MTSATSCRWRTASAVFHGFGNGVVRGTVPDMTLDLDQRPILVFWEATRACGLACRHCRASASAACSGCRASSTMPKRLALLDSLTEFGDAAPGVRGDGRRRARCAADLDRIASRRATRTDCHGRARPERDAAARPRRACGELAARGVQDRVPQPRRRRPRDARRHPRRRRPLRRDARCDPAVAPPRDHGAGEHGRDARLGRGAADDRAGSCATPAQASGRCSSSSTSAAARAVGDLDAGGERGRVPLPRRRLALRAHRPHGRGAVLPARRSRSETSGIAPRDRPALRPPRRAAPRRARAAARASRRRRRRGRATGGASSSSATTATIYAVRLPPARARQRPRGRASSRVYRDHPLLRRIRAARLRRPLRRPARSASSAAARGRARSPRPATRSPRTRAACSRPPRPGTGGG